MKNEEFKSFAQVSIVEYNNLILTMQKYNDLLELNSETYLEYKDKLDKYDTLLKKANEDIKELIDACVGANFTINYEDIQTYHLNKDNIVNYLNKYHFKNGDIVYERIDNDENL